MSIKFVKALKPAETYTHTHTHTHTSSLLLSFLSIILISAPAFSYVTNSSHCDNDVLSTYSGSANLTANWQGNPISVTWYNGDTQYDSNQCTYGGNLTMPSSIPQKTGYTFKGWRVKSCFNNYSCGLNSSSANTNSLWYASKSSAGYCFYYNGDTGYESTNCSDSHITGLNNGEWKVDVSHGIIKGISMCNNVPSNTWETTFEGIMNGTITTITTEEQLIGFIYNSCTSDAVKPGNAFNNAGTGQYCWCKMTSYTPINGSECNTSSSAWMVVYMDGGHDNTNDCIQYCPSDCANIVSESSLIRNVIFGATGNQ